MTEQRPQLAVVSRSGVPMPVAVGTSSPSSPPQPHSDDELMLLARGGVARAFDELVRRHQVRVLAVAARRMGRSALAADVAQNTFIEIYRALPRYRPCGLFKAYLYRVLLNQCRMAQRSARAARGETRAIEPPPEPEVSAEARILARERERDVETALAQLSDKLRDVVLLRYSAELRYEEVAAALSIPVGTVKRRLFDAMEKLRCLMEET